MLSRLGWLLLVFPPTASSNRMACRGFSSTPALERLKASFAPSITSGNMTALVIHALLATNTAFRRAFGSTSISSYRLYISIQDLPHEAKGAMVRRNATIIAFALAILYPVGYPRQSKA